MNDPQNPYPYTQPASPNPGDGQPDYRPTPGPQDEPKPPDPVVATVPTPVGETAKRRRNGKIAKLPKDLRDRVCEMILDGLTYAEIVKALSEHGIAVSEDSVGTWKAGGYQDWLRGQERLDELRIRQEVRRDLVPENDGVKTHQAASEIAALNLCDVLEDLKPAVLKEALTTDPATYCMLLGSYTRLLSVLPKLSAAELECERRRDELSEKMAKDNKGDAPEKPRGLSEGTRRLIEKEMNLM
jgi:hypothetical protein